MDNDNSASPKEEHILCINEVCRLCLEKKKNMGYLTEKNNAKLLFECAAIQLTANDELFNLICKGCIQQLELWYSFKKKIVKSFEIGCQLVEAYFKEEERLIKCEESDDTCIVEYIEADVANDNYVSSIIYVAENEEELESILKCNINNDDVENESLENAEAVLKSEKVNKKKAKKLKCQFCEKSYMRRTKLNEHVRLHTGETPYKCHLCSNSYRTQPSFRLHLKDAHNIETPFMCSKCPQNFYLKEELSLHLLSHQGEKPICCDYCEKTFPSMFALHGHMKVHNFKCDICSTSYTNNKAYLKHMRVKHKKLLLPPQSSSSPVPPENNSTNGFLCTICGIIFKTRRSLRGHMDFRHIRNKKHKCTFCDAAFIAKNQLDSHLRKHTGEQRRIIVHCPQCGKGCANRTELKVHMRFHTGERPFKCDLCDRSFIIKGNLTTHRRSHTGEKPFTCRFCHKGFRETSSMKVHERVHTGERPYSCPECGKAFYKRYNLSVHLKVHR